MKLLLKLKRIKTLILHSIIEKIIILSKLAVIPKNHFQAQKKEHVVSFCCIIILQRINKNKMEEYNALF